jgi:hypothetical protein
MREFDGGETATNGLRFRRCEWCREAAWLLAIAALAALLLANSSLDILAAGIFYRPDALDHWPIAGQFPRSLLYQSAPWITA